MNRLHDTSPERRYGAALDRVLELTVLLGDDMARDLAARGLTRARTHLLWVLDHGGPATQRALAEALGVSARNVTGLVDGLEQTGFVTREPHPTDRRATLVTPTAAGEDAIDRLRREHAELARQLFAGLSARRFDEFAKGLDEVLAALRDALG